MTRRKIMISLAVLLAAVVGLEVFLGSHDRPVETAKVGSAEPPLKAVTMTIEFPPIDRYSEFIERPLFSNTRRAFQPSDKAPFDPGGITAFNLDLELSGITLSGTQKLALIKTKTDNSQHRVGQGEEFRGWRLEEVLADKVVMQNGVQIHELALIRKGDPLAAKRKKLQKQQKQSQEHKQRRSAEAQAEDKKAKKSSRREARVGEEAEREVSPAEAESDEEE